jgi:serine protease inhibitor
MNEPHGKDLTIEQLLARFAERPLSEAERQQLSALICDDDDQLAELVTSLEMDAMLHWHFGRVPQIDTPYSGRGTTSPSNSAPAPPSRPVRRGSERRIGRGVAAALATSAVAVLAMLALLQPHPPHGVPAPGKPVRLTSGWTVQPTGAAVYRVMDAQRLRLDRGELFVQSALVGSSPVEALVIETPWATATASGTQFYIGAHQPSDPGGMIMTPLTRVLVLAGSVTLSNAVADVRGEEGDLLSARQDEAPVRLVVRASNDFAWRLFGRLTAEAPEKNVFFSPYSISTALAMAAEGARGETALQMGEALGFPEEARRIGDDAQLIPWRMSLLNSGAAQLQERLNRRSDASTQQVRERIALLRTRLETLNQQVVERQSQKDFNGAFAAQREAQKLAREINELLSQIEQYELNVANAVWGDRSFPFDDGYVKTINATYRTGGAFPVDFANDYNAARQEINAWITEHTGGQVRQMLGPEAISPLTRLVLTNAVYFLGHWSEPFPEDATGPVPFQLADGGTIEVPGMSDWKNRAWYGAVNADGSSFDTPRLVRRDGADADARYPAADGFQVLEMPYKGEELSMIFILPRSVDGLPRARELLMSGRLDEWLSAADRRTVRVMTPKFEAASSYSLADSLQALGMELAFSDEPSPGGADFSGMTASQDVQDQLYLDSVFHKARLSVHERGTEAVAATVIVAEPKAERQPVEMVPFTPEFRADRPFVYLIRDRKSGAILFLGSMLNPELL